MAQFLELELSTPFRREQVLFLTFDGTFLLIAVALIDMVQPSSQLWARLRFTTKQVGRGFYRGNRTGSTGAHTGFGGYVVDWRKTRHFVMPGLQGLQVSSHMAQRIVHPLTVTTALSVCHQRNPGAANASNSTRWHSIHPGEGGCF